MLVHDAFVYESDEGYVSTVAPFVRLGLQAGEPIVAVTMSRSRALLQEALGADGAGVHWIDAESWFVRPAHTIAAYDRVFRGHLESGAGRLRVVAEVQFGASRFEHDVWTSYEAILNRAFESRPAWIVCPYDTRCLPDDVVASAYETHPHVLGPGLRSRNERFVDPARFVGKRAIASRVPDAGPLAEMTVDPLDVATARRVVGETAARLGIPGERVPDLVLAVDEIVSNALVHGAGPVRLATWSSGSSVVCEVTDQGAGFDDPLAGYVPPPVEADGGRGLWIARQLCDHLQFLRLVDRFAVRLSFAL